MSGDRSMHSNPVGRRTIGFLSSWHVYEGASIEPYTFSLIKGIRSAAADFSYRLLLACGIGPLAYEQTGAPAWPNLETPSTNFAPVGPWNTDGLIVLATEMTEAQREYIQSLRKRGFPIVFAGPDEDGPSVMADNFEGIRRAVDHLYQHGHRQIAFISGLKRWAGDSTQRRKAFFEKMNALGLEVDPALTAYGYHSFTGGQQAMRQILETGRPFTAVVASNDRSAMGAITALQESGRRVPEDIAVIGFDDVLEAKAFTPPLTTIRNDSFLLGYRAAAWLLEMIQGSKSQDERIKIPAPLVIRRSCGCAAFAQPQTDLADEQPCESLSAEMALKIQARALFVSRAEIDEQCRNLAAAFLENAGGPSPERFLSTLVSILDHTERHDDDILAWNSAITVLRDRLETLFHQDQERRQAENLLDEARLAISERARRAFARQQSQKAELNNRLNMMTAQLLAALEMDQVRSALDQHLGEIGIERMLVVFFKEDGDDPIARSEVIHSFGFEQDLAGQEFVTRQFPPAGWFNAAAPLQVALLPFNIHDRIRGFAAFETRQIEPLAVIVRSLVSALRTSFLYTDAVRGRKMAEEADKMKSRFLSMVSHELRTPLNVIAGLSEILLRQKGQPPGPGLWSDLERIYANSQHLGRLIGDVLDLVSNETGQLRLMREPLNLSEVFKPVIATGMQMARDKSLAWNVIMEEDDIYVMGDQTRLRQVALNLISNAVKYTFSGSVTFEVRREGDEVTVSVHDTGIGVPPEDQAKMFTEFGQSELSIRRGIHGIGLGLAITRELVERQGGKIGVRSPGKNGCGSTFFFTLPVIPPPEPKEILEDPLVPPRVLLLTNNDGGAEALNEKLQERGIRLDICLLQQEPDWYNRLLDPPAAALILDKAVAAVHGWEILALLKRREVTASLPVLVWSADRDGGSSLLVDFDFQLKPLNAEQITRILTAHGIDSALSTILIVDDNAEIRSFHARLIDQQMPGCRVLEAENGRAALEIISQTRPDLVLLDLIMPEVDGFAVLDEMRQQEATRDIPVIVLTAKMITEDDIARLNQSVAAVLSKGTFRGPEILDHIMNVLENTARLGTASQQMVRVAVAYIQTHYAEPLTRDQIAKHVNVSPDHLSDCFHREMGITPMAYLNRYRIVQARRLLDEGRLSITQVALEVGFSDSAHFSRVFHREVGMSPRSYQKRGK